MSEQKNFRPSGPKFWLFSKIAFYLSIKIFVKKLFFWKKLMKFYLFWTLKENSAYWRFFLAVLSILHFFCERRDSLGISCCFWRESDFGKNFDIEWNISGLVAYLFWLGCQKCILRAHGNVLKSFSFFNWICFFNDFPHCVKMFCFLPKYHRQSCQNCILPVH